MLKKNKSSSKSGSHARVAKGLAPMLSCLAHDMDLTSKLISRMKMLSKINERLPLIIITGISFAMLFLVDAACSRFDYVRPPTDNVKDDSKMWTMKLFRESPVGVCWVQVDMIEWINLIAHNVIVATIVKERK